MWQLQPVAAPACGAPAVGTAPRASRSPTRRPGAPPAVAVLGRPSRWPAGRSALVSPRPRPRLPRFALLRELSSLPLVILPRIFSIPVCGGLK